jgi:hypothetical protein
MIFDESAVRRLSRTRFALLSRMLSALFAPTTTRPPLEQITRNETRCLPGSTRATAMVIERVLLNIGAPRPIDMRETAHSRAIEHDPAARRVTPRYREVPTIGDQQQRRWLRHGDVCQEQRRRTADGLVCCELADACNPFGRGVACAARRISSSISGWSG